MTQNPDPKLFPIFAGPTMGELQNLLGEALADVLWDDGLEHLSAISKSLDSISTSLQSTALLLERIADALEGGAPQIISCVTCGHQKTVHTPEHGCYEVGCDCKAFT